jgi:hypothetical protein
MEVIEMPHGEPLPRAKPVREQAPTPEPSEDEGERFRTVPERLREDPGELEIESTEEKQERQTLCVRLGRYRNSFPQETEGFKLSRKHLTRKSLAALRELADDVKHQVGTRRTGEQFKGLFLAGVNVAEMTLPMVGMEVAGLTNIISQNGDILKTVDEIAISRDAAVYIAPEMRLAGAVIQIILALDTHNRAKKPQEPTPVARERAAAQQWQRADNVAAPPAEFDDL